ncbi:hypothetical protein Tco_0786425 [Tanacetum coccineum]
MCGWENACFRGVHVVDWLRGVVAVSKTIADDEVESWPLGCVSAIFCISVIHYDKKQDMIEIDEVMSDGLRERFVREDIRCELRLPLFQQCMRWFRGNCRSREGGCELSSSRGTCMGLYREGCAKQLFVLLRFCSALLFVGLLLVCEIGDVGLERSVVQSGCSLQGTQFLKPMWVNVWFSSSLFASKEHGKLLIDSILYGAFKYGTVIEPRTLTTPSTVRDRRYDEFTDEEKIREACDIKSTNIVLQGLPQDIYNLVNHHSEAKNIWDRVKLLIEDVKLAKGLHNTNFDHLYAYLRQQEAHANEVCLMKERFLNPLALVANTYNSLSSYTNQTQNHQQLSPIAQQFCSPLAQPHTNDEPMVPQRSYQPLAANHSSMVHHQSYQAPAIHQPPQASFPPMDSGLAGRQTQGYASSGVRSSPTGLSVNINGGTSTAGQTKVIHCYNYQEEGHIARQCTKPKRPRNSAWFKEKAMLVEALESGVVLDEEQMALLAKNEDTFITSQAFHKIPTPSVFQTDD